jgi:U3 small nucleolar ribonucleoprotein protein LCP5
MAAISSLPALLATLTQSLSSANEITPKSAAIEPSKNGISLLDVKNELLVSYLQNLVFLILLKLRNAKRAGDEPNDEEDGGMSASVVEKLVELRLYLEKGVRPLEGKLKYQIEKMLRAASDAERNEKELQARSSAAAAQSADSDSSSHSGSDEELSDKDEDEEPDANANAASLRAVANPSAFVKSSAGTGATGTTSTGVYRPPRIAPTTMPKTERRDRSERRAHKSATLDEFVATELSAAPLAEPSIGTTIVSGGRRMKTEAERRDEAERREYEESNFVRLPKESKKDRAKKAKASGQSGRLNFGGEEWRDLGEGVDRIERLTKRKDGGSRTVALLEKSRKRGLDATDRPRGSGVANGTEIGERYHKRLKVLDAGRRDRGKGR